MFGVGQCECTIKINSKTDVKQPRTNDSLRYFGEDGAIWYCYRTTGVNKGALPGVDVVDEVLLVEELQLPLDVSVLQEQVVDRVAVPREVGRTFPPELLVLIPRQEAGVGVQRLQTTLQK